MSVDPEEAKKALKRGTFFGFVPHRLSPIDPDFQHYPFNVLFMSHAIKDGQKISGSALYEPEFHTYKKEGPFSCMKYRNVYGGDCYLLIVYDEKNKTHHGEKFVNGKLIGSADGGDDWNNFFVQLTMLGLADGEKCKFERDDDHGIRSCK